MSLKTVPFYYGACAKYNVDVQSLCK